MACATSPFGENAGADAPRGWACRRDRPAATTNDGAVNASAAAGAAALKLRTADGDRLDRGGDHCGRWPTARPRQRRNHPALKVLPSARASGAVGALVTKTLVIAGDPLSTTGPNRPRGAMLRAYDKTDGKEIGAVYMPAPQSGTPMTYALDGKQYIVVAVSGGTYSGEYIAFTLGRR